MLQLQPSLSFASVAPSPYLSENTTAFFYDQTHIAGLVERSISFCLMKKHEWKAMGRVIYGSRKTAFFEEKKANFAARTGRRVTSMLPQIGLKENSVQFYGCRLN
jgi:hypothetical protein